MAKLQYTFKRDTVFKMLFTKYEHLLKQLIAGILCIDPASITKFVVYIREIPPEAIWSKFCRLDISMTINDKRLVNLEIQVEKEPDYARRAVYLGAKVCASSLKKGEAYSELPEVIFISFLDFKLFECAEYFSRYMLLEVTRHTLMTDRIGFYFYELPKLPDKLNADNELELWLALFKAETEEDLAKLEALEVPMVQEVIEAYNSVIATDEFMQAEWLREIAEHDEASALQNAREKEREKWQGVLAEKDVVLAEKDALIAKLQAQLQSVAIL